MYNRAGRDILWYTESCYITFRMILHLYFSAAMLQYLINKYKISGHWYPTDIRQRARLVEYVMWHYSASGLRMGAVMIFVEQVGIFYRTLRVQAS